MEALNEILDRCQAWGDTPAIVTLGRGRSDSRSYAELAAAARVVTGRLGATGIARGDIVGLIGPAGFDWVASWLGIIGAGAAALPLDEQLTEEHLARFVGESGCKVIAAHPRHHERLGRLVDAGRTTVIPLGVGDEAGTAPASREAARPDPADLAVVVYTSGTTGRPKAVPLTHANIASNIASLLAEKLVAAGDRVLLPLPLHHVYPLTVGLLTSLSSGATVIVPAGLSGPDLAEALRHGGVTHLVGIPKLYAALLRAITARIESQSRIGARVFQALLRASMAIRRVLGLRIGRPLFWPLHRGLAPSLRILVCGGAALDPELELSLEGLGWEVLTGYGLTETAPILAFNRRGHARLGSAGKAIAGVRLRIANADAEGIGEVEATGPNVFAGYRGAAESSRASFTEDGWFRTGDLGRVDGDGFLHLVARRSETIVLPGGKKIFPEEVEAAYAESPAVKDIALLERDGALVALVLPDPETARAAGPDGIEKKLRDALAAVAAKLPSYQRLSGLAVARAALPRTPLGKLQRHKLLEAYDSAREGRAPKRDEPLSAEDEALLAGETAARLWRWLQERFPDKGLTLDTSPQFDLGIDSLGWVSLTLEMQQALGITLSEEALAKVASIRDLLREASAAPDQPGRAVAADADPAEWLRPLPPGLLWLRRRLEGLNRWVIKSAFHLEVDGQDLLPAQGPFLICPNHGSFLDPVAIGAAVPPALLPRVYWAGWTGIMFTGRWQRWVSRLAYVIPIDPLRPAASLAVGREALRAGQVLVWFPEGSRSLTGAIERFLPGVVALIRESQVPVVPARIRGAFEAWPRSRRWPRRHPVSVRFGAPLAAAELLGEEEGDDQRVADRIRAAVERL